MGDSSIYQGLDVQVWGPEDLRTYAKTVALTAGRDKKILLVQLAASVAKAWALTSLRDPGSKKWDENNILKHNA